MVTEGFATVEDVAFVEPDEIASIEGFGEETAEELQARARDFLEREAAEYDEKRKALGVEDGVLEIEGVTLPMSVALGEGEVKSVEDLAGLVPDDLRGWFETKNGERVRETGVLESFNLTPEAAENLIMQARIAMGWVEAPTEEELIEEDYATEEDAWAKRGTAAAEDISPEVTLDKMTLRRRRIRRPPPTRKRRASAATWSPAR